jgi:hypothetical protein
MNTKLTWVKSSYSGTQGGNCVEVAGQADAGRVLVRDSKNAAGPVLRFSRADWRRFAASIKQS